MRSTWLRWIFLFCLLLFLDLAMGAGAEEEAYFGYTKGKTETYAEPAYNKKTGKKIPAYTVVRVTRMGQKYLGLEDGTYVLAKEIGLFHVLSAKGKVVYWEKDQVLYGTGNTNHPLSVRVPAHTPVAPLHVMAEYYLVSWEGVYGFAPISTAQDPPTAKPCSPVFAALSPDVPLYDLPLDLCGTSFRLPENKAMIIGKKAGDFYPVPWNDRIYYVKDQDLPSLGAAVSAPAEEGYADREIPLLDFPDQALGRRIGAVPAHTACALNYGVNEYVQVTLDGVTGFARRGDFLYPGGNGKDRYYLFLDKSTRQLTVYQADAQGEKTGQACFSVTVAVGKFTTPTPSGIFLLGKRERWHFFGISYAPYAIAYAPGRFVHGPLYWSKRESSLNQARLADFGKAVTGGCVRTPYDAVQWIYFHCAEGTKLEIVNGVRAPSVQVDAEQNDH